jgi:hypothetical protein
VEAIFLLMPKKPFNITIPPATVDVLLREDVDFLSLIGLYNFYYYTALWQKTNQPKCTLSYTCKCTNASGSRVRKLKRILVKAGLIEEIQSKKANGDFGPCYIKLRYYTGTNRVGLKPRTTRNRKTNAYSNNNLNAYSYNKNTLSGVPDSLFGPSDELSFDDRMTNKLVNTIQKNRKVMRKINVKKWSTICKKFRQSHSIKKRQFKKVLFWYIKNMKEEYVPQAYSMRGFCDKFDRIEAAMERQLEKQKAGQQKTKYKVTRK